LDVKKLAGLLEREKVNCLVIDGDRAMDHCILKIWTNKRPGVAGFIEYRNEGTEPRFVGLIIRHETFTLNPEDYPLDWEKVLKLSGKRTLDAEIITRWLANVFIEQSH
jgi:hypothetical protein